MAVAKSDEMTIDELAHAAGMTSRNIRAYQSSGLMPAPRLRGRTGYYAAEHLDRLRLIQELQAEGFSLKTIQRLLVSWGGSSGEMLTFKRAFLAPFTEEEAEIIDARQLASRFGGEIEPKLERKAEALGLIRDLGEGRYEVPSPRLLRAGESLVELGIPLSHVLAVAEQILRHAQAIADSFLRLFMQDVMEPVQRAGNAGDLRSAREAVERLRPLAREAIVAGFEQTMMRAVEREFGRIIEK